MNTFVPIHPLTQKKTKPGKGYFKKGETLGIQAEMSYFGSVLVINFECQKVIDVIWN